MFLRSIYFRRDSLRTANLRQEDRERERWWKGYRRTTRGNRILGKETQWPVDILSFVGSFVETINRASRHKRKGGKERNGRKKGEKKTMRRRRRRRPTRRHCGRKRSLYTYKALWHAKEVAAYLFAYASVQQWYQPYTSLLVRCILRWPRNTSSATRREAQNIRCRFLNGPQFFAKVINKTRKSENEEDIRDLHY